MTKNHAQHEVSDVAVFIIFISIVAAVGLLGLFWSLSQPVIIELGLGADGTATASLVHGGQLELTHFGGQLTITGPAWIMKEYSPGDLLQDIRSVIR